MESRMGILQVVKHLAPLLPKHMVFVEDMANADVIISHAGAIQTLPQAHQGFIAICHGLYPTADYPMGDFENQVNGYLAKNLAVADAVIVPSQWVAAVMRRDLFINPIVLKWGVSLDEWQPVNAPVPGNYVLWNKNRNDAVCNPEWMNAVARTMPQTAFVSTFGNGATNVKIIGSTPYEIMQGWVKNAGVYLATTKETGDIGSREALAAGVPVVGFAHGALLDFLQHGVNGYLVPPGDVEGLKRGIAYCFKYRETLSQNAIQLAQGYAWEPTAEAFAQTIESVVAKKQSEYTNPLITVVVPVHNYAQYVGDAITSVLSQQDVSFELIVVDDASTDNSLAVIEATIANDPRAKVVRHEVNYGVAQTRNHGLIEGRGKYALCLDADDFLNQDTLRQLSIHMELNPLLGIAYGRLAFEDGSLSDWLTLPFDYDRQVDGTFNQVPTCCMFRREDALRVGGYRSYMQPAEDADLWTRLTTFTGRTAQRVMDGVSFFYRRHPGSLSQTMRRNPYAERGLPTWGTPDHRPFAAPPAQGKRFTNPVKAYDLPLVKVELVGEGDRLLTIDSLYEQTEGRWTLDPRQTAPLGLRVQAGAWLPTAFLAKAVQAKVYAKDKQQVNEVYTMACCGRVDKQMVPSAEEMILVRWTMNTYDNPIPSFTAQRGADERVVVYRGNLGDSLYVFRADYEYSVKNNRACWELVPENQTLTVIPTLPPAPEPPKPLPVMDFTQTTAMNTADLAAMLDELDTFPQPPPLPNVPMLAEEDTEPVQDNFEVVTDGNGAVIAANIADPTPITGLRGKRERRHTRKEVAANG